MRSESGGAGSAPSLPAKLQSDHRRFAGAVGPWLEQLPLGLQSLQLLTKYGLLVHEFAASLAIVSKGDRPEIFTRHVLDSLNPVSLFPDPPRTALDVGSGAGFPGIPLAIVWPNTRWFLVESREKKAGFLEKAVRDLGLKNVEVICSRVEDLASAKAHELRAPVESVFVRALGNLPGTLAAVASVSAPGARWIYFLGGSGDPQELAARLGPNGSGARAEPGAFGGSLLHGVLATAASPTLP